MTMGRSSATRRGESRSVGPETLSAATARPGLVEHGRGDRAEARARARRPRWRSRRGGSAPARRRAAPARRSCCEVSASSGARRAPRGGEGEQHLAVGRAVVGHAAADPVARAEVVAALDLREVLDAAGPGHGDVDRLPRRLGQRGHRALGGLDQPARRDAAAGVARPSPGRRGTRRAGPPARRGRCARARRAGARPCSSGRPGVGGELAEPARRVGLEHAASAAARRGRCSAFPASG